tara:strand:+ start:222 stop:425 length:204 start_codon:yes stop_codon:yes gene_type:complete
MVSELDVSQTRREYASGQQLVELEYFPNLRCVRLGGNAPGVNGWLNSEYFPNRRCVRLGGNVPGVNG